MAYHHDFWIAIATAGPVIALSFIVAVERSLSDALTGLPVRPGALDIPHWVLTGEKRRARSAIEGRPFPEKIRRRWGVATLLLMSPHVVASVGFGVSGLVTVDALNCLSAERDKFTTGSVQLGIGLSLVLLLVHQTVSLVVRNSYLWKWPKPDPDDALTRHHPMPGPQHPGGTRPPGG